MVMHMQQSHKSSLQVIRNLRKVLLQLLSWRTGVFQNRKTSQLTFHKFWKVFPILSVPPRGEQQMRKVKGGRTRRSPAEFQMTQRDKHPSRSTAWQMQKHQTQETTLWQDYHLSFTMANLEMKIVSIHITIL